MKCLQTGFIAVFLAFVLSACGGGSGGGDAGGAIGDNSAGFPDVAGRYSFNTSQFRVSCTDGSSSTNPPLALNFDVSQVANSISMFNVTTGGGSLPGLTILESTQATGNVNRDATFTSNQFATAVIDGIPGTVSLSYTVTGRFSSSGWSGDYYYSASSGSLGTCNFTSTFNGDLISSARQTASVSEQVLMPATGIYDLYGLIASLVGAR